MLTSSVIEILRVFDKSELKKFEDFIKSPYFNKKTVVVKLFKFIKKFSPEFKNESLKREIIWKNLYPAKDFNYGVMKNLIHDLSKVTESFLQIQIFESDNFRKQFYLLENLNQRSNKKLFSSKFKILYEKIHSQKLFTPENYEHLKDLNILDYDFHFKNVSINKNDNLTYTIAEYEIYYSLIECFKNYNNIVVFRLRNNYKKEINVLEVFLDKLAIANIIEEVKKLSEFDYTILNTYYLMYLATQHSEEPDYYYSYKNFLINNDKLFEDSEKRLLYNLLENTLTLNEKIPNRNKEYFEIDKIRIKRKIILDKNKNISFNEFAAIVKTASDFKETEFLESFINTYLKNVPLPIRKNAEIFSNAFLYYNKGELDKALEIIVSHDMNSSEYRLNLRALNLKILYDKNDFLSSEYMIDSFRHYLSKDGVPEAYRNSYLNFCKFLSRLFKIRESKDKSEYSLLRHEVTENVTANKTWLLEKINEL
ncbi:MAG: hypothetical protein M3R36_10340 [Bacteroidota bacterium]|nr:hypothetical protein [Bacteroidota bacterium]